MTRPSSRQPTDVMALAISAAKDNGGVLTRLETTGMFAWCGKNERALNNRFTDVTVRALVRNGLAKWIAHHPTGRYPTALRIAGAA